MGKSELPADVTCVPNWWSGEIENTKKAGSCLTWQCSDYQAMNAEQSPCSPHNLQYWQ